MQCQEASFDSVKLTHAHIHRGIKITLIDHLHDLLQ